MPRPIKCRKVCRLPENNGFKPTHSTCKLEDIILTVEEYETIRLIDKENYSQEQCGEYMHIARTTVQQIYTTARGKIASALVEGRAITITGGNYRLCNGHNSSCNCNNCHRRLNNIKNDNGENI